MDFIKLLHNLFCSKRNTAQSNITLENFIQDVLIKQIGEIKKEHPYLAFLLISSGIEFLGKCISTSQFQISGNSKRDFNNALNKFSSLSKYSTINLYGIVRCGLCHAMQPKLGIKLSDSMKQDLNSKMPLININNLYEDFKISCEELLSNKQNYLPLNRTLSNIFIQIDTDTSGNSSSGATSNY